MQRTTVGYAVAHPLSPRLRETLFPAVKRFAVHVLQHRGLAGMHAAHRSFAMRGAAKPSIAQVAPVDRIRLWDVRGRAGAVSLSRHDVRRHLNPARERQRLRQGVKQRQTMKREARRRGGGSVRARRRKGSIEEGQGFEQFGFPFSFCACGSKKEKKEKKSAGRVDWGACVRHMSFFALTQRSACHD